MKAPSCVLSPRFLHSSALQRGLGSPQIPPPPSSFPAVNPGDVQSITQWVPASPSASPGSQPNCRQPIIYLCSYPEPPALPCCPSRAGPQLCFSSPPPCQGFTTSQTKGMQGGIRWRKLSGHLGESKKHYLQLLKPCQNPHCEGV